ncbi:MAG: right-handed parallel beta-helix repeat-containing protein [Bacteroidetes bacterium]|nr:right-handed parallel beta-helix repeat-containing protein [Bacteroidota bacterium]
MKLLFTSLFTFSFLSLLATDTFIYISPNGKGNGSAKTPTSLEKAMALLPSLKKSNPNGTITIILLDGEYELNSPLLITNENGGTQNLKIIFKAAPNAHPILSGGKKILLKGDKILSADISPDLKNNNPPEDIYVNGKRAIRARTPDNDFFKLGKTDETKDSAMIGIGKSIQHYEIPASLYSTLSRLSASQLKNVRFNIYHKWMNTMLHIDSLDKKDTAFYVTGPAWKPYGPIEQHSVFYMENAIESLNTVNEWLLDWDMIKYIPNDLNIKEQEITIPTLEKLLIIKGDSNREVSNVTFEGISFRYCNTSSMFANDPQAAMSVQAAIMVDYANAIHFFNCEITHVGEYGIWLRKAVHDCDISHCYVHELGAGGVRIGETLSQTEINKNMRFSSGNRVSNCIIHSGGYNYPTAVGVFVGDAYNNFIAHNDIGDFRYSGVSVGWVWGYGYSPTVNNKIIFNHIHHIGWGVLSDMAAVYTLGISNGTEVSNNIIHDIYSYDYGGWGLYTDEGSTHIRMENNLVYNTKTGGFHQHYGKDNIIRNNILAFGEKFLAQFSRIEDHHSFDFRHNILISDKGFLLQGAWQHGNVTVDSNCYWCINNEKCLFMQSTMSYGGEPRVVLTFDQWRQQSGRDAHSFFHDPGFVNAKEHNFKFKNGSIIHKIGFKPFDLNEVGVQGDLKWKQLAKLPKEIIDDFNESVNKNMLP